jgi:hypothetical protein
MNYLTLTPTASASTALETEIMFSVASARAQKIEFLKIDIGREKEGGARAAVLKLLRLLKKQGRIQLFVDVRDLRGTSTEAQYLINKYPDALEVFGADEAAIIVKI